MRHDQLKPGYPPFRMKAADASYYSGMSISAFRKAVERGELPAGRKLTGGVFWLRAELEEAMLPKGKAKGDFGQRI